MNSNTKSLIIALKYLIPAILWSIFIGFLCFTPAQELPKWEVLSFDKIGHFGIFAILVFFCIWGLAKGSESRMSLKTAILIAVLYSLIYSLLIEIIQASFIPGRSGEVVDFLADAIGCFIGLLVYQLWRKYFS